MTGALQAQTAQALVARADDHYFNLEYEEAIRDYYAAMAASQASGAVWNRIATTILYQELNRLGMLETSAFRGDNEFLDQEKPKPDPEAKKRFLGALAEARRLAEAGRLKNPRTTSPAVRLVPELRPERQLLVHDRQILYRRAAGGE